MYNVVDAPKNGVIMISDKFNDDHKRYDILTNLRLSSDNVFELSNIKYQIQLIF